MAINGNKIHDWWMTVAFTICTVPQSVILGASPDMHQDKIIIFSKNISGSFPRMKTFLSQVCYLNAVFILWNVKIMDFSARVW